MGLSTSTKISKLIYLHIYGLLKSVSLIENVHQSSIVVGLNVSKYLLLPAAAGCKSFRNARYTLILSTDQYFFLHPN